MRLALLLMLWSGAALGQQASSNPCDYFTTFDWKNVGIYDYQQLVLRSIYPLDQALVSVSVFSDRKAPVVFLRKVGPNTFEIVTAELETPIQAQLLSLSASCSISPDPHSTTKLLKINWKRKAISQPEFHQLYDTFAKALSEYAKELRLRASSNVAQMMVQGHEFTVCFDTAGFEQFTIAANDTLDENHKVGDPMAAWAATFLSQVRRIMSK